MKLITEEDVEKLLADGVPQIFYIPEGKILSPAARDYLNRQLVSIDMEKNREANEQLQLRKNAESAENVEHAESAEKSSPEEHKNTRSLHQNQPEAGAFPHGYVDYETGGVYEKKPEYMTHMYGNQLVRKDCPIIRYRGKLDRLQAEVVLTQSIFAAEAGKEWVLADLEEVLQVLRELMRCELMQEPVHIPTIFGLDQEELREHSHHAEKYYHVKTMQLPHYKYGVGYAYLNLLRTSIRETELLAVEAFHKGSQEERLDIIQVWNRLSSALHILMCKSFDV